MAIFYNVTLSIATFGGAAPALKLSDQRFDFKDEFSASAGNEALLDPFEFVRAALRPLVFQDSPVPPKGTKDGNKK